MDESSDEDSDEKLAESHYKRSKIYKHFVGTDEDDSKLMCNYCKKLFVVGNVKL